MPTPEPGVTPGPELFVRRRRLHAVREQVPVVATVALGGALGACARYGMELAWPTPSGGFPWATLVVNVGGCALMGALMVAITEVWVGHRLLRPLLGTGVLGGYTTFSTFAGDVDSLAAAGHLARALLYLLTTPVLVLVATWTAAAFTRRLITRRTS
ncbi:fluoride efflux transporter FluC [Mycolicibacter kumamotonensis]|uniref:Fluoride-specific ion channel FluC n=1 Tax=Mycolicibacter kumamotonensis TaxID=354243 RepID=A0A7K3LBC4_9MYCO|nr:CrcB family protein [Mycolicibacter kumamotonensis]NDJ89667.1 CrcB family protein [Mycolicibacter kumamotonensis]